MNDAPLSLDLRWRWCAFDALTPRELQNIYMARQQVFGIEQACAYLDADGHDEEAFHLAAWAPGHRVPLAYCRVLLPGAKYVEASIGRVLTTGAARGVGLGRELMRRAIDHAAQAFPQSAIRIAAQSRLEGFYAGFGFVIASKRYLEDGIDHTEMWLAAPAAR
jgi:ElaA protein